MALVGTSGEDAVLRISVDTKKAVDELEVFTANAKKLFTEISSKWQEFAAFLSRGGQVGDVFGNLQIGIDKASEATRGLISRFDLAVAANRAYAAGLHLTEEQLATVAVASQKYAEATGGNATEAMDRLTHAISTGSSRALREFGIDLEKNDNRLVKAGDALKALEGRFGGMTSEADDAGDSIDRLTNQFNDLKDAAAAAAANNSGLAKGLQLFADINGAVEHLVVALGGATGKFSLFNAAVQGIVDAAMGPLSTLGRMYENLVGIRDTVNDLIRMAAGPQAASIGEGEAPDRARGMPGGGISAPSRAARALSAADAVDADARRRAGIRTAARSSLRTSRAGGGAGAEDSAGDARATELFREIERQRTEAKRAESEVRGRIEQDERDREIAFVNFTHEAQMRAMATETAARIRFANQQKDAQIHAAAQVAEAEKRSRAEAAAAVHSYTQAVIGATIAGINSGKSALGVAKDVIAAVLQEISGKAAAQAAYYFALGLGLEATTMGLPNPGSVSAFGSAALFSAIALGSGLGAGAVSAGGGGAGRGRGGAQQAAASGPSVVGSGGPGGGGGGGPVTFTVIVNAAGDVVDDGTYRRLGRVVSEAARRGYLKRAA